MSLGDLAHTMISDSARGLKMIQQIEKTHRWTDDLRKREALTRKETSEPVFFFDGDFRTWGQVQFRAQLNMALAHRDG